MKFTVPNIVGGVCGLMLFIVLLQAVTDPLPPTAPPPVPASACVGSPIAVSYEFAGWKKPHECIVQCADDKPRYILYADGLATQCEMPPGCNDLGEDKGVTCTPPLVSPAS